MICKPETEVAACNVLEYVVKDFLGPMIGSTAVDTQYPGQLERPNIPPVQCEELDGKQPMLM